MSHWSATGTGPCSATTCAPRRLTRLTRQTPPWTPTRRHRRSRGGRPASSTRGCGARCSTARRRPPSPRATSCAARNPRHRPTGRHLDHDRPGCRQPTRHRDCGHDKRPAEPVRPRRESLDRGRQGVPAGHNGPLSRSGPGGSPNRPERQRRGRGGYPGSFRGGCDYPSTCVTLKHDLTPVAGDAVGRREAE